MARRPKPPAPLDRELTDVPQALRWRTWMGRVEAVIFAASAPVPREVLAHVVGEGCRLDDLLGDICEELRNRPYELVEVAGGWQHRTRKGFADAIHISGAVAGSGSGLSEYETLVLTAIAYLQPATRAKLSRALGREVSRDTIASIRAAGLITAGPRSPQPGAPATAVTTPTFLSAFGLATLRDLPDIEAFEDADLLQQMRFGDGALPGDFGFDDEQIAFDEGLGDAVGEGG